MQHHAPEVWIGEDAVSFTREGVRRVAEAARRSITARGRFLLALAGGNTPRRLYRALAQEDLDWSRVVLLFSDERLVPLDDAESNYRMARETLIDQVPLSPPNVHPVPTHLPPIEAAAAYEVVLRGLLDPRELGGQGFGPRRKVQVLLGTVADDADAKARALALRIGALDPSQGFSARHGSLRAR